MIAAVIADDLTGAAELASAAAELGFSAEVQTAFDPVSDAEIICLDTNSRTLSPDQAANVVAHATQQLLQLNPAWLFKKTDSVLRGNVSAEIESILRTSNLTRAVLAPANPSKCRVIRDGTYFVDGIPLSQTAFAHDPHHPRTTSDVGAMLGSPSKTIDIPDVTDSADLHRLASSLTTQSLPAGGVDFFRAVLQHRTTLRPAPAAPLHFAPPTLFCSGSLHGWSTTSAAEFRTRSIPILPMPEDLRAPTPTRNTTLNEWAVDVHKILASNSCVAISIGEACATPPDLLTTPMAAVVSQILSRTPIPTLVIEGGATAFAILHALHFTRLKSVPTPALPGIAALHPHATATPAILLKPGSYPWPPTLWPHVTH